MALAIDTSELTWRVNALNRVWQNFVEDFTFQGQVQIYKASALGTVIHDASSISRLHFNRPAATQEALDWQPDPDDELDDVEVLYHLNKQAKSSPVLESAFSHTDRSIASTTVMASCAFPPSALPASAQGRPLSAFHRYSVRLSWLDIPGKRRRYPSASSNAIDNSEIPRLLILPLFHSAKSNFLKPGLVDQFDQCVVWQLQFHIVDYRRRRGRPNCHLRRGRRSTINPFHRVPAPRIQEDPQSNSRKENKQFRGVRYREDHKRWTAEMKPPNFKNKDYFGEFKSQTHAARVVDVAYHYYGKPLNFSDTPHILEERPIPANINDEDKLKFVKEQAKWVSSIYSTLPSSPACGEEVDGEGDDGTREPQLSFHLEATAGLVKDGMAEDSLGVAGVVGGANTLQEQQGLPEWSTSALSLWSPTSSMRIIDDEDGAEHSTAPSSTNLRRTLEPFCDSHAQLDVDELVIFERRNAKRLRTSIPAHQFSPSERVAVAGSSFSAYTAATPVIPATFSPCPCDGDPDQGDHGICEPQSWHQRDPMAGSREPNRVVADGVDGGAVIGTLQEQQALSVRNVENLLCPSLRSPNSFNSETSERANFEVL